MSEKEKTDILKALELIKSEFTELYERTIQQNSGSNSGLLSRMVALEQKIEQSQIENRELHEAQSKEITTIKENLQKLTLDTEPLVEGKKTATSIFKFVGWASPLAIIYGVFKWLKL